MHPTAVGAYFLHVYNVDSGLWASTMLDQRVSPHSVVAMNHILRQDGINAIIGLRSESGPLGLELEKRHARDGQRCWISLPASEILKKLGFRLNSLTPEKPVMAFHGSPLVTLLGLILADQSRRLLSALLLAEGQEKSLTFRVEDWTHLGLDRSFEITPDELGEVLSYAAFSERN